MSKFFSLCLAFLWFLPSFTSAQFSTPNDKKLRTIDLKNAKVDNLDDSFYVEQWSYSIILENNVHITYVFSINEIGKFKKRVTGVKLSVTWLDGKTYVINKEYDLSDLIFNSKDYFIKVHPERNYWATQFVNNAQDLYFATEKNDVQLKLELSLSNATQALIWGDGIFNFRTDKMKIEYLIPHADISGRVIVNEDTLQSKGFVSMVHTYQTGLTTKFFNKGIRYKSGDTQNGFISFSMFSKKNDFILGYGIEFKNGSSRLLIPDSVVEQETIRIRKRAVNKSFTFNYKNNSKHFIEVKNYISDYSILDDISGFTKMLARNFLGAEIVELKGHGFLNNSEVVYLDSFVVD